MSLDKKLGKLVGRYRIARPANFRLADFDPADTGGLGIGKDEARKIVADHGRRLATLQEKLYAQDKWSVLMILQGMDAAGKDGIVEHVLYGVNPLGCDVHSFKAPNAEELDHNYLWRVARRLPERGRIGIFNRSHYEECLVVRVHPEILAKQKLPPPLVTRNIWKERFEDICAFERHLVRNGMVVLKFHLRISKEEQRRRFLDRLNDPDKRWKFAMGDVAERGLWNKYMAAYQDMIRQTSIPEAPWIVVPADHKWFARLLVSLALVEAMERLDLKFPLAGEHSPAELKKVASALEAEGRAEAGVRRAKSRD
ncbi:MAG: polyphosphate kinase 2 family protein [Pseudorhodoplanes sp.]|nr:polyphosphate kinase 2 family protein [Pseudorhodoplanes sp.]